MSDGKAGAQAGHAFVDTLLEGLEAGDACARRYAALRPGTKVLLCAPWHRCQEIAAVASALGIPCATIVDSGHVELPDFDGSPTPTAVGLGPFDAERPMPPVLARMLRAARPWPPRGGRVPSHHGHKGDLP